MVSPPSCPVLWEDVYRMLVSLLCLTFKGDCVSGVNRRKQVVDTQTFCSTALLEKRCEQFLLKFGVQLGWEKDE